MYRNQCGGRRELLIVFPPAKLEFRGFFTYLRSSLMEAVVNIAAYKFAPLSDLKTLRARLLALCREWDLKGTILLSPEGINLFVAGAPAKLEVLMAELRSIPGLQE